MVAGKSSSSEQLAQCTAAFMENYSIPGGCGTLFLSKVLGTLVLLGGLAFKVPQIMKLQKNKSADGVSLSQYALELCVSAISISFNYHISAPFSTYGESFFILAQNVIIVFQIRFYKNIVWGKFGVAWIFYIALGAFLFSDFARDLEVTAPVCKLSSGGLTDCKTGPVRLQDCLQLTNTFVMVASRVPQIMQNFRTRNVENLALVTWALNLSGASIRVFTTFKELPDQILLQGSFLLSAVLALTVVIQILLFAKPKLAKASAPPPADKLKDKKN